MIEYRAFSADDIGQLARLHKKVYHSRRSISSLEELHRWRYFENPSGTVKGAAAFLEGVLVGAYLLIPIHIRTESGITHLYQNATILVDPEWRGKGIAGGLLEHTADILRLAEYRGVIIDFPNSSSEWVHKKFFHKKDQAYCTATNHYNLRVPLTAYGALYSNSLRFAARLLLRAIDWPLRPFYQTAFKQTSNAPESISVERVNEVPEDYQSFWAKVEQFGMDVCFERNSEFLRWRYFAYPGKSILFYTCRVDGRLCGCFAFEPRGSELVLLDAYSDIRHLSLEQLLEVALRQASLLRANHVRLCTNSHPKMLQALSGFQPITIESATPFYCFSLCESAASQAVDLNNRGWFLTASEIELG